MNLNKQQRHSDLDNYWLETLLCLIGEAFDEQSDDICGAVVNIRGKGKQRFHISWFDGAAAGNSWEITILEL